MERFHIISRPPYCCPSGVGVDLFLVLKLSDHYTLLPIYPSPKPTFCPKWEVSVDIRLGEGQVGIDLHSC